MCTGVLKYATRVVFFSVYGSDEVFMYTEMLLLVFFVITTLTLIYEEPK